MFVVLMFAGQVEFGSRHGQQVGDHHQRQRPRESHQVGGPVPERLGEDLIRIARDRRLQVGDPPGA